MTQNEWNQPLPEEGQSPADAGFGASGEPDGDESRKKKISRPTVILFGAFASALAVLYLLGMQTRPRAASADQIAREDHAKAAITDLLQKDGKAKQLQNTFTNTKKMVDMFYAYLGTQKTETTPLSHDPFGADEAAPVSVPSTVKEAAKIVAANPADAEKIRQVAVEFGALKLQSVMTGRTSIAMINNHLVQVGNKLGDLTVISIESDRVLLSYHKNVFELKQAAADGAPQ